MKGFVNSWSVILIATSIIVLLSMFLFIDIDFRALDSGYIVELSRWYGDAAYTAAKGGTCDPKIFEKNVVKEGKDIQFSSSGRTRKLLYTGKLVNLNITYVKNYPPVIDIIDPLNGTTNQCVNTYTIQWTACDIDEDSLNYTVFLDSVVIGETNKTYLDVPCTTLDGTHAIKVTGTDGELNGSDTVIATFTSSS